MSAPNSHRRRKAKVRPPVEVEVPAPSVGNREGPSNASSTTTGEASLAGPSNSRFTMKEVSSSFGGSPHSQKAQS